MGLPFFVFLKVGGPRVFSVKKLPGVLSVKKLTLLLYTPLNYIGVHENGGGGGYTLLLIQVGRGGHRPFSILQKSRLDGIFL